MGKLQWPNLRLPNRPEREEFLRAGADVADEDGGAFLLPDDFRDGEAVGDGVEQLVENIFEVRDGGEDIAGEGGAALVVGGGRSGEDSALAAQDAVLAGFERGADLAVLLFEVAVEREGGGAVGNHQAPGGGGVVGAGEGDGVDADGGEDVGGHQLVGDRLLR